jgi:hypothetical protein
MENNGGIVMIAKEGGSYDLGMSALLMFCMEDLPSVIKREEKLT